MSVDTIFTQARNAHNLKLYVLAEELYRLDYHSRSVSVSSALYWLDCMILLGMDGEAERLIAELRTRQKSESDELLLTKRLDGHRAALENIERRKIIPDTIDVADMSEKMRIKPFYISSFGGSATAWVSASLSAHPDLVCYHGTMSYPPGRSDRNFRRMHPEDFMKSMVISAEATRFRKTFGAIHGYHGTSAKQAVEDLGGTFCGIIRHPLNRLKSLIHIHLDDLCQALDPKKLTACDGDIISCLASTKVDALRSRARHRLSHIFTSLVLYDMQIEGDCGKDSLFKMEDITSDRDAYSQFFSFVTNGELTASENYLNSVFDITDQNRRVVKNRGSFTLSKWPAYLKDAVLDAIDTIGRAQYILFYEKLGYDDLTN